ncbi:unnamed protein product [Closterium sp. NIES-54]
MRPLPLQGEGSAAAVGAAAPGAAALSGAAPATVLHTFTLDSGASRSFFRDRTTLMPLSRPVAVSLADPSGGPVLAHFSTVLPCPAAPSGSLSGLYLPSFSTNLVSGADLQDGGVDQFTHACQRVTHCTCAWTGRHLATFTRQPRSSLYTLTTESPPVAASGQVAESGQVFAAASRSGPESAPCSCRLLSHQTVLWHHRLGHPSLPRLRGMASQGRQRAAPHSSEFPPTEAPLQTLYMDVWGPARVRGQGHERYFLLVVDDYSRYTAVFPLRTKGEVSAVLIDWIRATRLQLRKSFGSDFPVLHLHPDRGGEFSSDLLRAFFRARGIRQTFTLPASPQQNGIAERRIGMVMDVALRGAADKPSTPCLLAGDLPHPAGPAPSGVSQVDAVEPVEVAVDSGATRGAGPAGAGSGGAEPDRAEPGGAGCGPGGARPCRVEPGGARPGGPSGASSRRELPSPQELREWFARHWSRDAGAGGATGAGGSAFAGGSGGTGPGGARAVGTGAAGPGGAAGARAGGAPGVGAAGGAAGIGAAGGVDAGGTAGAGASADAGVGAAGDAAGVGAARGAAGAGGAAGPECPPPVQSESQLQLASPLPAPPPYTGPTRGLAEHREPESRPASPVRAARAGRRVPHQRPAVLGTHQMALRPSTAPLRIPLPSPPESSLLALADPESDSLRTASPTVTRLLATIVSDASSASTAASALVAELVDVAAHCRLDYATTLLAESESVCPPSVGEGPYSSQWQTAMDAEMASWKSTGTYVDEVPPSGANIVSGMWIYRVKRPPGSPPVFKARYVAPGFSQRQGVDYFQTFSPTPKMTTLRVLLHIAAQRDYQLHSLDFSTAFLQGSLHEEIRLRRPPSFTGSFPPVLYVDNKAMLASCREHRLEHRTKHIALRYFLARELQECGQLRLAYVASQANTADIFTKALEPSDHQRFCTMLGLVPTWPHLLTS